MSVSPDSFLLLSQDLAQGVRHARSLASIKLWGNFFGPSSAEAWGQILRVRCGCDSSLRTSLPRHHCPGVHRHRRFQRCAASRAAHTGAGGGGPAPLRLQGVRGGRRELRRKGHGGDAVLSYLVDGPPVHQKQHDDGGATFTQLRCCRERLLLNDP